MGIFYHLVVTLVITLIYTELSSQSDHDPNIEGTAGQSSSGRSSEARPLKLTPRRARPHHTGPSSLVMTFGHPEPHGELTYEKFSYPPGFQTINQLTGDFMPIPSGQPLLSLTTANNYVLGILNQNLVFGGIHAEFDAKLHRFKIPKEGGRPVLLRPEEEREFYNFRQFDMKG